MNYKHLVLAIFSLSLIFTISFLTNKTEAQTTIDDTTKDINTATQTPTAKTTEIRERIRADIQNAQINQNTRVQMLEKNRLASTSPKISPPKINTRTNEDDRNRMIGKSLPASTTINQIRIEDRFIKCPGSTNPNEKCFRPEVKPEDKKDGYEENGRSMQIKALKEKKEMVAKQLNVAMQNLVELRKRISSRMEKDRLANKDLSSVTELLKIADKKIAIAKDAIATLRAYSPTTTQNLTIAQTASTTKQIVNLDQVRDLIEKAQKSIKEAHKALVDVITAIAKISGTNIERKTVNPIPLNAVLPAPSPIKTTLPSPENI